MLPVAILAGGLATRMRPHTVSVPKAMLDINGRPFIDHQLRLLAEKGVGSVVLCTGFLGEQISEFVGGGERYSLKVSYSSDWPDLLGTGGAVKKTLPLLGEAFLVLYGDSYLDLDYQAVCDSFAETDAEALMTVYENDNAFEASNVLFEGGALQLYAKTRPEPGMRHIDYGLTAFRAGVFLQEKRERFDLADLLENLSRQGRLAGSLVHTRFYEIGSPSGIEALRAHLAGKCRPPA